MKARTLHEHEREEERDAGAVFLLNEREEKAPYRHREGEGEGEGEGEAPCPCFADKKNTRASERVGRLSRSLLTTTSGQAGEGVRGAGALLYCCLYSVSLRQNPNYPFSKP